MKCALTFVILFAAFPGIAPSQEQDTNAADSVFSQPWDANAWEAGSGANFWRKTGLPSSRQPPSGASAPTIPALPPTSSPFPDRQTEK